MPSTKQHINFLYCLFMTAGSWKFVSGSWKYLDDDLNNDLSEAVFLGAYRVGLLIGHDQVFSLLWYLLTKHFENFLDFSFFLVIDSIYVNMDCGHMPLVLPKRIGCIPAIPSPLVAPTSNAGGFQDGKVFFVTHSWLEWCLAWAISV